MSKLLKTLLVDMFLCFFLLVAMAEFDEARRLWRGYGDEKDDDESTEDSYSDKELVPCIKSAPSAPRQRSEAIQIDEEMVPVMARAAKAGADETKQPDAKKRGNEPKQSEAKTRGADTKPPDAEERGSAVKKEHLVNLLLVKKAQVKNELERAAPRKRKSADIGELSKPIDAAKRARAARKSCENRTERAAAHTRESTEIGVSSDTSSTLVSTWHPIEELPTIVRVFAIGWFPSETFDLLCKAATEENARGSSSLLRCIKNFKSAFLRNDKQWNTSLKDMLSQLSQIRRSYANEFSPLSETHTSDCLWSFARAFILTPQQLQLDKKEQHDQLKHVLKTQFVCYHRLRAVIRIGLRSFENVHTKSLMLQRFLDYMEDVENITESYKNDEKRTHEVEQMPAPTPENHRRSAPSAGMTSNSQPRPRAAHSSALVALALRSAPVALALRSSRPRSPLRAAKKRDGDDVDDSSDVTEEEEAEDLAKRRVRFDRSGARED